MQKTPNNQVSPQHRHFLTLKCGNEPTAGTEKTLNIAVVSPPRRPELWKESGFPMAPPSPSNWNPLRSGELIGEVELPETARVWAAISLS